MVRTTILISPSRGGGSGSATVPPRRGPQDANNKKKVEIAENKFLDVKREPDPVLFREFAREYLKWSKANKPALIR